MQFVNRVSDTESSNPLVHPNHRSITGVDVIDIFGGINAEWDHSKANTTSEYTDQGEN